MREKSRCGLTVRLLLLSLFASFSFGAVTKIALASHYHTACVPHGFVHGSDTNDGSFFARIEYGCGTGVRRCAIYNYGQWRGDQTVTARRPVMRGRGPSVILSSVLRPPTCGTRACSPTMFTRHTTGVPDATRPTTHGSRLHGCLSCGPRSLGQ